MPAIRQIRFFDPLHGWAIGEPSAYFPSGVFATDDGGRSWSALPAGDTRRWLTGDFVDPDNGALAGRTSALAAVRRRAVETSTADYRLRG